MTLLYTPLQDNLHWCCLCCSCHRLDDRAVDGIMWSRIKRLCSDVSEVRPLHHIRTRIVMFWAAHSDASVRWGCRGDRDVAHSVGTTVRSQATRCCSTERGASLMPSAPAMPCCFDGLACAKRV